MSVNFVSFLFTQSANIFPNDVYQWTRVPTKTNPANQRFTLFFVVAGLTYTICSYLAYIQNCNHHHNNNTTQTKWMRFGVKTTKLGGRIICVWVSLAFAKLYTHFELINTHRLGSHMILYIYMIIMLNAGEFNFTCITFSIIRNEC